MSTQREIPLAEAYEKFGADRTTVMADAEQFLTPAVMAQIPDLKSRIDLTVRLYAKQHEKLHDIFSNLELTLKELYPAGLVSQKLAGKIHAANKLKKYPEHKKKLFNKNIYDITLSDLQNLPLGEEYKIQATAAVIAAKALHKIHGAKLPHTQKSISQAQALVHVAARPSTAKGMVYGNE